MGLSRGSMWGTWMPPGDLLYDKVLRFIPHDPNRSRPPRPRPRLQGPIMTRRMVILTEGHSDPHTAKTACSVMRYRPDEVVAVLDSDSVGMSIAERLGVPIDAPFISQLAEADGANTLLIGIAPPGGRIPDAWRQVVLEAIDRGMEIVSGLHDFLSDDAEFVRAAEAAGVQLVDVRKNDETSIARRIGIRADCLRVHTVGHDCSVGKMVTSIEITEGLKARGVDAKFVATGQTGIMVSGEGCPVDRVVADFVSGAAERLLLENQQHDVLVFEGQGSLVHPSYSAVTLGILHGCLPHALVMCYEVGRETITGVEHVKIPSLDRIRDLYLSMANIFQRCDFVGVSMNSRRVSVDEAEREKDRIRDLLGLPVCDVFRDGPSELVEAVASYRDSGLWKDEIS
jgi:uncharacterized NAD-dependent epimerase/dehydratase family protein